MLIPLALLAFAIAFAIAELELITSKYPRTIQLFWNRSWALWAYGLVYGLISAGFTLGYKALAQQGIVTIHIGSGGAPAPSGDPSIWVAVMLGLSAKALMHIRLFSIPSGGSEEAMPFGTESIARLFEPWLLQEIALDEFNVVRAFLAPIEAKYTDLAAVKAKLVANIPPTLDPTARAALITDIQSSADVESALELYLRQFGVVSIDRIFPVGLPGRTPLPPPPSPPPPPFLPPPPDLPIDKP
jgi:hypothetical protein